MAQKKKIIYLIIRQLVSFIERKDYFILIVFISTVILLGSLYSSYLGKNLRYFDEQQYYNLANNIAKSHNYSLDVESSTACKPPGYPLFLSLFILAGGTIIHLRILNFILLGICIYLSYKILKKHSSTFAAIISPLLIICYPVLFYTAGTLYPQIFSSLILLLILYFLTQNIVSRRILFLCGLLFGYLILTVPVFIFALIVFAIYFYVSERSIGVKRFSITFLTALLLVSIWCIRNYLVFDSFVLVSSNSGINLLLGNSENTTPNSGTNVDISKYTSEADQLQLNEIKRDAYYRSKANEWILSNKMNALKLFSLKYFNNFNYRNKLATKQEASFVKDYIMLFTYGPLLLLFVCRILLMKYMKPSKFEGLLIMLYFSSAFFYAIFFTRIRFRIPFDFLLIMIVAMFLKDIFHVWLDRGNVGSERKWG